MLVAMLDAPLAKASRKESPKISFLPRKVFTAVLCSSLNVKNIHPVLVNLLLISKTTLNGGLLLLLLCFLGVACSTWKADG